MGIDAKYKLVIEKYESLNETQVFFKKMNETHDKIK